MHALLEDIVEYKYLKTNALVIDRIWAIHIRLVSIQYGGWWLVCFRRWQPGHPPWHLTQDNHLLFSAQLSAYVVWLFTIHLKHSASVWVFVFFLNLIV